MEEHAQLSDSIDQEPSLQENGNKSFPPISVFRLVNITDFHFEIRRKEPVLVF